MAPDCLFAVLVSKRHYPTTILIIKMMESLYQSITTMVLCYISWPLVYYCTIVLHSLCQLSIIYVYLSCDNGSYRELCCLRSGRDWAVVGTSSDIPTPRQHDTRTATAWQQERDIRRPDNTSSLGMSRRHTRIQHIYLLILY